MTNKQTILVVDDERLNLVLFERIFSKKYRVLTAISGEAGILQMEKNPDIDIVISDMQMPGLNGIEFIEQVKPKNSGTHYFILTGYEINEQIKHALEEGTIEHYFQKPFDKEKIEAILNNLEQGNSKS